jgi:hypothetical protein
MDDEILRFFDYSHLPHHLQQVSQPFHSLAFQILTSVPECEQRHLALVKLLEAKDCTVRAAL